MIAKEEVYEDEYLDEEEFDDDGSEEDLLLALQEQWGSAPWYVSSLAIHTVFFLILMAIPVPQEKEKDPPIIVQANIIDPEEEKEEQAEPDIEENDPVLPEEEIKTPAPIIITTDFELSDHNETADDMDKNTAKGEPDNISTIDDVSGKPALMGVGASGGSGGAGRFGDRNGGGRRNLVARGGGGRRTERAVDWALRWLKEHQEPDGHWDAIKYGGGQSHEPRECDASVTSLALLAFLGSGNSTTFGKYKGVVTKAVAWLKKKQQGSGLIGNHRYEGGITMMAMSEAYGMSQDPTLKSVAQKCVNYAARTQGGAGGWRYTPDCQDVDTSVTGWWIMGLKSAKVAGLSVPPELMQKSLRYFEQATQVVGAGEASVSYSSDTTNVNNVTRGGGTPVMTAVALTCLQFLGKGRDDPQVAACAGQALKDGVPGGELDFYRWYYCALGLFQMGTESKYWQDWNPAMVKTILSSQVRVGTFKQNKGSWNPDEDSWGAAWGRCGQTAMGALMLEVYYRYYNVHKKKKH